MTKKEISKKKLENLIEKGVQIPCPESVEIGDEVSPDLISGEGVTIHAGCKLFGADTVVMDGVELGYEAPVTVDNCQLGANVKLKGGFFQGSVFMKGASMGSGAQVRSGCLLEEEAKGAHNVGLKQTILFPFVTLGSLINFCDCLMAGGTDDKNHSEVGSSYIHFNYTPNQDKATPSLIGDVQRGVMINQDPIFLGGQGGMVGPVRIEYGTIVAAGTIVRKDILKGNTMLLGHTSLSRSIPFRAGLYTNIKRIVYLNTNYISGLIALRRWYLDIRAGFMSGDDRALAVHNGAVRIIENAIKERLKRLGAVAGKLPRSIEIHKDSAGKNVSESLITSQKEFFDKWPEIENAFFDGFDLIGDPVKREGFQNVIGKVGTGYIGAIKSLNRGESDLGTSWLQELIELVNRRIFNMLPSLNIKLNLPQVNK